MDTIRPDQLRTMHLGTLNTRTEHKDQGRIVSAYILLGCAIVGCGLMIFCVGMKIGMEHGYRQADQVAVQELGSGAE